MHHHSSDVAALKPFWAERRRDRNGAATDRCREAVTGWCLAGSDAATIPQLVAPGSDAIT